MTGFPLAHPDDSNAVMAVLFARTQLRPVGLRLGQGDRLRSVAESQSQGDIVKARTVAAPK
jgi:hypothetical protein